MGDLSGLILQAQARIAETTREKDAIMYSIGELDREIAETTRYLAQKETDRATVQFARPRNVELDAELERLNYEVTMLVDGLKALESSKAACLSKMQELDLKLAGDRRVVEICSREGSMMDLGE